VHKIDKSRKDKKNHGMIDFIRMGNQKEAPKVKEEDKNARVKQFVSVLYKDKGDNVF